MNITWPDVWWRVQCRCESILLTESSCDKEMLLEIRKYLRKSTTGLDVGCRWIYTRLHGVTFQKISASMVLFSSSRSTFRILDSRLSSCATVSGYHRRFRRLCWLEIIGWMELTGFSEPPTEPGNGGSIFGGRRHCACPFSTQTSTGATTRFAK